VEGALQHLVAGARGIAGWLIGIIFDDIIREEDAAVASPTSRAMLHCLDFIIMILVLLLCRTCLSLALHALTH